MFGNRPDRPTHSPPALLVADPDRTWCDIVGRLADNQGLRPVVAASAEQAAAVVERGLVGVAILGSRLERPDTMSAFRILRSIDPSLPTVLVLAETGRRVMEDALALAAFAVVRNPVDDALLADVLRRIMARHFVRYSGGAH